MQRAVYSGRKRSHGLKFRVLSLPDGAILHAFGPTEGGKELEECLLVHGKQFPLYRYSGCTRKAWMGTPHQGENLIAAKKEENESRSKSRETVEL
eukprot:IDg13563t1